MGIRLKSTPAGAEAAGLFARYNALLVSNPILTKSVTAFILTAIGDAACQVFVEGGEFNWTRFIQFSILGGVLVGPGLHFWYGAINKAIPGTTTGAVLGRLAADQLVWAPIFIAFFMSCLKVIQGNADQIMDNLTTNVWSALKMNWTMWPAAQFINFKFVPQTHQVLFANFISLIWNTYLSYQSNLSVPDKDAEAETKE